MSAGWDTFLLSQRGALRSSLRPSQSLARVTAASVDEPTSSRAKKMVSAPSDSKYLVRHGCALRSPHSPVSTYKMVTAYSEFATLKN